MDYKAIIVGSGPAGYTAAIRLSQLGAKVAIVERDMVGGICVNWGCTPSKAMISSAKVLKTLKTAEHYGISVGEYKVDFQRVAARRDEVIFKSREEIRHLLEHWQVDIINGSANYVDEHHVEVNGQSYEAENIIIASGSEPLVPGFLQKEDPTIVNSNKLVSIKELPESLTIVGGGIIGLEFATMFAHFGCRVRIIELLDRCLATMDPEISTEITKELEAIGIEVLTGHKVLDISNGVLKVEKVGGAVTEINSPMNLIAIGRKAVINPEQMQRLGIEFTPKGIVVDSNLRASKPNIYAVGDATGLSILAHVAIQQGIIVAENIMGASREMNYDVIPAVVYTLPEVATVGKVPEVSETVKTFNFPFSANLRANIEEHNSGFVKLWVNTATNKLLAAQMIGDFAGEIIQAYGDIIALDTDIEKVANTIHAHPTYSEIVRNSLEFVLGRAIEYYS